MPSQEQACDTEVLGERLADVVGGENVAFSEPMSEHTTFRIGGPADIFVCPSTAEEVVGCVEVCREAGAPWFVLGRGSDTLVADGGYRGVVIALGEALSDAMVDEEGDLVCEAGVTLRDACEMAAALGLTGIEFACGIPGTIGGAVFMNAGAYGGDMASVLVAVRALDPATGEVRDIPVDELAMGYRTSLVRTAGLVALSATIALEPGDEDAIRARMASLDEQRAAKQPLELPSAGSVFKRPEGYFAGKLISDAGLAGARIGGAQVSEKHCGFIVNAGDATAEDVRALIAHVQDEVERTSGVRLEPEVRFLGM